jgi:hypothetical protein
MNLEDTHARARQLITQEFVDHLDAGDQRWMEEHLRECAACSAVATETSRALQSLRAVPIAVPQGLARRTQFRVRLRAQELSNGASQKRLLWLSCGASWLFGAVSAPYVWRGLQWAGERMALPHAVPELGFGLWWALPAIVAAAIVFVENAKGETRQDWFRHQD